MTAIVRAVLAGRIEPLGGTEGGTMSSIGKTPQSGPQNVQELGLVTDHQADLRVHGGPDKALHCYAWSHYDFWRERLPGHELLNEPGAFGENLSIAGLEEADVCLADRWRVGNTLLEVTQGRQPCYKLNLRFGIRSMASWVQDTLRAGWYLRVLTTGAISAGDKIELVERPYPAFSIAHLLTVIRDRDTRPEVLEPILALPLTPSWRKLFSRRLDLKHAEDWSGRLGN